MKLVYAITASDEEYELFKLLNHLKRFTLDSIVVQLDSNKTIKGLYEKVKLYTEHVYYFPFHNDFSQFKNTLNRYCYSKGFDYIFQLDADEMISEKMIKNIKTIIENDVNYVDSIYIPRINIVENISDDILKKWNWQMNDKGWINYPDYQGRIFRPNLEWCGRVHEKICGENIRWWAFPENEDYSIVHYKNIDKQVNQNDLYTKMV